MSDTIFLNGLGLHAYHGVMQHEAKVGQTFYVDLQLGLELANASRTDKLKDTVSYDFVIKIVAEAFCGRRYRLVEAAAGAAVDGGGRLAIGIEMHQQAVGARRRPGFLDTERLHAADLHRLETVGATGIGRRHPIVRRHGGDHLVAEIVLLQDEFDQMGAAGEDTEVEAAAAIGMQPRGITRQVAQNGLRPRRVIAG